MFEIVGKIRRIGNIINVNSNFVKRDFFIDYFENKDYLQVIKFTLLQNCVEGIEGYVVGDNIKVFFNLRGNEVEKNNELNVYNSLNVWKIESVKQEEKKQVQNVSKNIRVESKDLSPEERNDEPLMF